MQILAMRPLHYHPGASAGRGAQTLKFFRLTSESAQGTSLLG